MSALRGTGAEMLSRRLSRSYVSLSMPQPCASMINHGQSLHLHGTKGCCGESAQFWLQLDEDAPDCTIFTSGWLAARVLNSGEGHRNLTERARRIVQCCLWHLPFLNLNLRQAQAGIDNGIDRTTMLSWPPSSPDDALSGARYMFSGSYGAVR